MRKVLDDYSIEYEERDDELWSLCPNPEHNDHRPSWSINSESGRHYCFSCGYGGNVEMLIASLEGTTDWGIVRERAGAYVTLAQRPSAGHGDDAEPPSAIDPALLASFTDPPPAALARRRLAVHACRHYDVHYDESRWILPIHRGLDLLGWQVKVDEKGGAVWNHPKGVRTGGSLFGEGVARATATVMVVESPLDAVRLYSLGHQAISTWGVGLSRDQIRLLGYFPHLMLAFDNDTAGRRATDQCIEALQPYCRSLTVFAYVTDDKDVGDMAAATIDAGVERSFHASDW